MENGLSGSNQNRKHGASGPNAAPVEGASLDALSSPARPSDPSTTHEAKLLAELPREGGGSYELYRGVLSDSIHFRALFYLTKIPALTPGGEIGVRGYYADLPALDSERWQNKVVELFKSSAPEHFEAFFVEQCNGQLIGRPEQVVEESKPSLPPAPTKTEFFAPLGSPVYTLSRTNGAQIRVYRDHKINDFVVTLSASADHVSEDGKKQYSDCMAFRLKHSQHWHNHQPIVEQLEKLRTHDEQELSATLEDFISRDTKGQQGILFKGALPTSIPIHDILNLAPAKLHNCLELSRIEDRHTTFSQRLLERSESLVARHIRMPSEGVLSFDSIQITVNNNGYGVCTLNVAQADGLRLNHSLNPEAEATRISYDFNLSDMSRANRQGWFVCMLQAFEDNRDSLHGPLTRFIERNCNDSSAGTVRMSEKGRTSNLSLFRIRESEALNFFISEISSHFKLAKPEVLAKTQEGAIIQATNPKGDRLQFTVRPHGIEEICVLLRDGSFSSPPESPPAIRFPVPYRNQLGLISPTNFRHLVQYFQSENGEIEEIRNIRNEKAGDLGALNTSSYLGGLTSRDANVDRTATYLSPPIMRCARSVSSTDTTPTRGLA